MTQTPNAPLADDTDSGRSTGLSRRAVVAGVGGVAAAGLLTACGGGSTATAPGTPATAAPAAPAEAPSEPAEPSAAGGSVASSGATALAATSEVPVGGGIILDDADYVITQPSKGKFKAFSKICTHQNCPVTDIEGRSIICRCHGSAFSIEDGSVQTGPATRPLPEAEVTVAGNQVVVTA